MVLNENGEVMEERGLSQRGWGLRAPPLDPQPMAAQQEKQPDQGPEENGMARQHGEDKESAHVPEERPRAINEGKQTRS